MFICSIFGLKFYTQWLHLTYNAARQEVADGNQAVRNFSDFLHQMECAIEYHLEIHNIFSTAKTYSRLNSKWKADINWNKLWFVD